MTDSDDVDRYRAPRSTRASTFSNCWRGEEEGLSQAEIAKALGRTPERTLPHARAPGPARLCVAQRQRPL